MKVKSMTEAWEIAHTMIDDLQFDNIRTERGSGKTWSKPDTNETVIDLGDRLEVNTADGKTTNIWIEEHNVELKSEEFKEFICDLSIFANGYVEEIKKQLVEIAFEIFKDKTLVKLLQEYAIRKSKEDIQLQQNFLMAIKNPEIEITFSNNCLTNADHYKTVLAGMLVDGWWHECNRGK